MINVSQPFLPPESEYQAMISKIWETKWLTNNGQMVRELEGKLADYLCVKSISYVSNGTIALQLALRALDIKGEVITTPFSFVATTTSILWENCIPVFVDIDPNTLCIDPNKIEEAITEKTEAILATHVFGIPCDVDKIKEIAKKHNLKVIYDAAHAFGVKYKTKSLLSYGDLSTLSFHATKLYHTVEGGAIVNNNKEELNDQIKLLRSFGYEGNNYNIAGINAKNSEFHAAMGLSNLKYIDHIIQERKEITELYDNLLLRSGLVRPILPADVEYNYAYYPLIFQDEEQLLKAMKILEKNQVQARRYFYPSLNTLPYLEKMYSCKISEGISKRILCLPLYNGLEIQQIETISHHILECTK